RDGRGLPGPVHTGREPVRLRAARRPRRGQGDGVRGPVHRGPRRVAASAGRDAFRAMAGPAPEPAVRGPGAVAAGLRAPVADTGARPNGGGGGPELPDPPAGAVAVA